MTRIAARIDSSRLFSMDESVDGSTHEDLLILSASMRGADIMEIYSPPRVTEVCRKYWLEPSESLDLKSGWDLSDRGEQQRAQALVGSRAPCLVICFPLVLSIVNPEPQQSDQWSRVA